MAIKYLQTSSITQHRSRFENRKLLALKISSQKADNLWGILMAVKRRAQNLESMDVSLNPAACLETTCSNLLGLGGHLNHLSGLWGSWPDIL